MSYENMTYEYILNRMMDRVIVNYPNLDYREGSIIFNALAPAALELAIMYTELDNALNESFVLTASREYTLIGCDQMGMDITVFEASHGIHKGAFNVEVPIGSRWNCELYNYVVTEFIGVEDSLYTYRMECETAGSAPNTLTGTLTAISDSPSGLGYSELIECLIEGENETSDEGVVNAYFEYIQHVATDGNLAQYRKWCTEYDGIGKFKITPLWNGANTVKVIILSPSNQVASTELINEFQEYLDPNTEGMGNGVAPIGAFVTVSTATELPIDVSATVTLKEDYSNTDALNEALTDYFTKIAFEQTTVGYMNIGATLLNVEGVESINNLTVSGGTTDVTLTNEQIPTLGITTWTVS